MRSERLCASQGSEICSIIFRMILYLQFDHSFPYHFNLNFLTVTRRDSNGKVIQIIIWFTPQLIKTYKCSRDIVPILKLVCSFYCRWSLCGFVLLGTGNCKIYIRQHQLLRNTSVKSWQCLLLQIISAILLTSPGRLQDMLLGCQASLALLLVVQG